MLPFPFSLFSPFNQVFEKFVNAPSTDWRNFYSPNVVFQYNPEDEALEQHVLRKVGSYGRQLGLVIDMLQLVRAHLPIADTTLSQTERELVREFDAMSHEVRDAISSYRAQQSPTVAPLSEDAQIDELIARINVLKAQNHSRLADVENALQH